MDKKGSITLTLILGAIILVSLILIFAIPKFRVFVVGLLFIISGLSIAIKGKLTKVRTFFVFMFVAIGLVIFFFGNGLVQQTVLGASYLSIDSIDVDGVVKIRTTAVTNGAENMVIDWTTSEMNSELDGFATTKPVTGSIKLINPTREFKVTPENSKTFYKYAFIDLGILKNCANNIPAGTQSVGRIATNTCLYRFPAGTYSIFNGLTIDNTPVQINIGGSTGTINPSTGNNVVVLNDGKTKVEWVGSMVNYQGLNAPYQYAVLQKNSQYTALIDSNSFTNYLLHSDTFDDCIGSARRSILNYGTVGIVGIFKSDTISRACVNDYNNKITSTLSDKRQVYQTSINANSLNFTSNGIVVDLKVATVFPVLTVTLDAAKVGLVELKGEPSITKCVSSQCISSGDTINPVLSVENVGVDAGQFYGNVVCESGVFGTIAEQFVEKGEIVNMAIQLSGTNTNTADLNSKCTYTIIDRKSQLKDSCSSTICVEYKPNIICEPNSITCANSLYIRTCNSKGTDFIDEKCEKECKLLDTGKATCINDEEGCGNGMCEANFGEDEFSCPSDCSNLKCEEKTPKIFGWQEVTTEKQTLLSRLGITKPKETNWCKPVNEPYIIGGALILVLGLSALFIFKPSKKTKGKSTKYGKLGK